jgi:hypothetical protein
MLTACSWVVRMYKWNKQHHDEIHPYLQEIAGRHGPIERDSRRGDVTVPWNLPNTSHDRISTFWQSGNDRPDGTEGIESLEFVSSRDQMCDSLVTFGGEGQKSAKVAMTPNGTCQCHGSIRPSKYARERRWLT